MPNGIFARVAMMGGAALLVAPTLAWAATEPACAIASPSPLPVPVVTAGTVATRTRGTMPFTATAGLLRVEGGGVPYGKSVCTVPEVVEASPPTATMSYYTYSATGAAAGKRRPIVFVWDGGPGASTRPMLLNSFGPIVLNPAETHVAGAQAAATRGNPDTLLDATDIVFIDAPGTGFGRLEGCNAARGFYGIDVDAAAFQRFIQQYLRVFHREHSPVVLMGESYGTVRAAVVAKRLQIAGTRVSGVILISQFLSLDAWSDGAKANIGTDNAFFLTLPTFAATAWWHGKVPHRGDLCDWLHEVERFSLDTYAPALLQGSDLSPKRRRALAKRLASYTGLSAATWLSEGLRIEGSRFRDLLEAGENRIVGREDTRDDGPKPRVHGTAVEDDPRPASLAALSREAFEQYVRGTLRLGNRPFAPFIDGPDTRWDMHHLTDPGAWPDTYANVAPDLVAALTADPALRVLVVGGYFDLAAPYFGGPYLISHLSLPAGAKDRIAWRAYPAPHDVYAVDEARRDMHAAIAQLIGYATASIAEK